MKTVLRYTVLVFLAIGLSIGGAGALIITDDSDVTVTYVGGNAGYNNEFGIASPTQTYLGMGHSTLPGTMFDPVPVLKNTPFIVYIKTPAGYTFYSEGANPDGIGHAVITQETDGDYLVGFEDLYGGGDRDFNDIQLRVHAEKTVIPIPEFPTLALPSVLIISVLGALFFLRNSKTP